MAKHRNISWHVLYSIVAFLMRRWVMRMSPHCLTELLLRRIAMIVCWTYKLLCLEVSPTVSKWRLSSKMSLVQQQMLNVHLFVGVQHVLLTVSAVPTKKKKWGLVFVLIDEQKETTKESSILTKEDWNFGSFVSSSCNVDILRTLRVLITLLLDLSSELHCGAALSDSWCCCCSFA